jgi:hypothetical protein
LRNYGIFLKYLLTNKAAWGKMGESPPGESSRALKKIYNKTVSTNERGSKHEADGECPQNSTFVPGGGDPE